MRVLCYAVVAAAGLAGCDVPLPLPGQPQGTGPSNRAVMRSGRVEFAWAGAELATRYVLQVSTDGGFGTTVHSETTGALAATIELRSDSDYWWRVRGLSADDVAGEWSAALTFRLERFRVTATCPLPGYAHAVALSGGRAYVADGQAGLAVVNVSDPESPTFLGSVMDSLNEAWGVAARDSYAFVAYGNKELVVVDTRRPDSMATVGVLEYPQPAYGFDLVLSDTMVYIAADAQFIAANVKDPRYPGLTFQHYYPRGCRAIAIDGARCFVALEQLGVAAWRLDTFPPRQVGSLDTPGNARGIAVRGGLAYVADGREGLMLMDVSDPADIRPVGSIDLAGYASAVALNESLAFVGCGDGGISVVDVRDPANLSVVARVESPYVMGLREQDGYVYACDRDLGLIVIKQEE